MCAALSLDGTELVIVAQNFEGEKTASVDLSKVPAAASAQLYRTSDAESCEWIETQDVTDGTLDMTLPQNSVSTFVIHAADGSAVCNMENTSKTVDADVVKPDSAWTSRTDKFTYTGSWGESSDEFGGGKYSTEEAAEVTFTFEGSQAAIYGTKAIDGAVVRVTVDGEEKGEVSLFGENKTADALLFYTDRLEEGVHTITLSKAESQGNKLIEINYARVIRGQFTEEASPQEKLLYFVDCNSPQSPVYQAYSEGAELLNDTGDQAYTEGSWGYRDEYGAYNGNVQDQYDTGWYAKEGQNIQYTFPLKAGTYQVSFGFKEWWNQSRPMKISMTKDGSEEELGTSDTWENGNNWNKDTYEITCKTDGEVTFTVAKAGNADPVLSFLQICSLGEETPVPEKSVDKTGLNLAVTMADALAKEQEANGCYTAESWAAVQTALEAAKALQEDPEVTQEQVDEAFIHLITAYGMLENGVQKVGLKAAVEGAEEILADEAAIAGYTPDSVNAVRTALADAEAVYGNREADQEAVNAATTNLLTAVTQLLAEKVENPDTRLDILIQAAEELLKKEDQYTPDSVQALKDALDKAKDTAADDQAGETQKKEVYDNLAKAMTELVRRANKAELTNALKKANEILKESGKYLKSSLEGLQAAADAAQTVYNDPNAGQDAVGEALKALINEILQVRLMGDVDLNGEVNTKDAAQVLQYEVELKSLTQEQLEVADVNGDTQADSADAGMILQYAAEKIKAFP